MRRLLLFIFFLPVLAANAQHKKPLDHSVYDNWQSIGEKLISNDGKYVVYTINPQEGDAELVVQDLSGKLLRIVPRGYNASITEDSRYLVFKIKPFFQETRQARIKKKKADEMTRDSLGILELGREEIVKIPRVKGYQTPAKGSGWMAYKLEKPLTDTAKKGKAPASDSIKTKKDEFRFDADGDNAAGSGAEEGTELVLRKMETNKERTFKGISEYHFDKKGTKLVLETTKNEKDSNSKAFVLLVDLNSEKADTIMRGFNDSKNYSFDEEGKQLAFVAERDSSAKALQKFYKLWYYTFSSDSAHLLVDKNTVGIQLGNTVSENASLVFSRDGKKLFFGVAAVKPPKDTTLVDFELARLDIWNYKDDYLQPQQLKQLDNELKRSYTAVIIPGENRFQQLGAADAEKITLVDEGNADWVLSESTLGNRIESQWTGHEKTTAYIINTADGKRKLVKANSLANFEPSPRGRFVYWYDPVAKNYFTYEVNKNLEKNISQKIRVPLFDEENDLPDQPNAYGIMGWQEGDSAVFVYDRYDIWKADPEGNFPAKNITGIGRESKLRIRYLQTDPEQRFFKKGQPVYYRFFDDADKSAEIVWSDIKDNFSFQQVDHGKVNFGSLKKAKNADVLAYTRESFSTSPDLFVNSVILHAVPSPVKLSAINPQQKEYNWLTAELFSWKAYNGKPALGLVYKPEDFDPKKKYPMICYFYERLSDGLYSYIPPSPTPSRLNISFYASRGYIVFVPDIVYGVGHPGRDAYDYVVSGARALVKKGIADSMRIGIQGQSWGGYQVAYLITATKLFAAAWAGAPVANMTSAYGGIRWESGLNRQFQYEKSQSRIGATLWENPQLYIQSSPLFSLPKVSTPLVIMSNDADGAVPWYQGIELFTGLRRLGKPVWLLQYNGEAHNLVERKNRKDIQIREQQFFDWLLTGEKPAKWLSAGVPATLKGIEWGLGN